MKMVIGGAAQGKKDAACRMFGLLPQEIADGAVCDPQEVFRCKALADFHLLVRRLMRDDIDIDAFLAQLVRENPSVILITEEIGCGIVPVESELRAWREKTGRACCYLAAEAETVVRVTAGLTQVIKGSADRL